MLVTLGLSTWVVSLLVALFLFVCVILILTVLIQRPQGGGLSGAFGSNAGSGQTAFGAKTGDALTIATIGMFVIYIVAATGLNYAVRPSVATADTPSATSPATPGSPEGASSAPAPEGAAPTTITIPPTTPPATATEPAPGGTAPSPAPSEPAPATPAPTPATPAPGGGN